MTRSSFISVILGSAGVGWLALAGCGGLEKTPFGFSLTVPAGVKIQTVRGDEFKQRVDVIHKARPKCLSGSIEPFLEIDPREYFKRLNHELDLSRRRPFLARPSVVGHTRHIYYSLVDAFDEERSAYLPAYVMAFQVKKKSWVGWLRLPCKDAALKQTALEIVMGLRVD